MAQVFEGEAMEALQEQGFYFNMSNKTNF